MGAQTDLRPGALRPLYTPGHPSQGLQDPVPSYLPPSRTKDKAPARGSHTESCHSPGLGPRAQLGPPSPNQQGNPPLAQCTTSPSRQRQAGGRERPPQALGRQFALLEARFGGETHRTGLQGATHPGPQGGSAKARVMPCPRNTGPQGGLE
ncbi:hypothetical protein NDU88_003078 [Pleurodeles waltl]|uniref:Uncharacterized protein n=1 Tax=Pleurodeles waltl TaxID=8319 RepID=A0AAV7WUA8_PLEWA|nr:hypothetical protein NDU88_003078 [Pleurodeles waltl]